ncbi:MAG: phosphoglycolate phosphatase [Acidobacteria bacterium]|nr:phosphoglycolate phosphatase [Acidobacteriota bacterium]
MIKVELLLFDLDGTLIDSRADLARSVNLMLTDLHRPQLSEAQVAGFVGDGVRVLTYRCLTATDAHQQPPDKELHEQAIRLMHQHYAEQMYVATQLYPQVKATLQHFKAKRKAVVTSKEERFTHQILEHFGIAEDFDCIIGGDTVSARKPNPLPVITAIHQLGGTANQALMVGDSENDILAGRDAGAQTCGVSFGFRTAEELQAYAPDVLIDRFDKLIENFF